MEDLALALRSALPIDDIDRLLIGPNEGIAMVWVDIQERPDLAQLSARHGQEGGYCICTLFYGNPGKRSMIIGLRVEMRQPTRTVFHLAFKVERYLEQLSLFAQFGKIWVVPGPPPAHLVGTQEMNMQEFTDKVVNFAGQGIVIELEPKLVTELRELLNEWKRLR